MKTLELSLPTPVLLVWGLPKENIKAISLYELTPMSMLSKYNFPSGEWQLIGKISELTEEQAKVLVENIEIPMFPDEVCFRDYNVTGFGGLDTPLESFRSAVESEGHYVENPIPPFHERGKDWQEAQRKTLPANTLIFKRV